MGNSAPLSGPSLTDSERARADQVIRSAFLTWRATGLLTGLAAVAAGWRRHRRPGLAALQLAGAATESLWLNRRLHRAERWSDPTAAAVDAAAAVSALAGGWANLRTEDRWTWLNWAPWSFATNVIAGQAMGVDGLGRAAAGATAVTAANVALDPRLSGGAATTGGMGAFFVIGRFFARQIRSGAERLAAAQEAAVTAGAALATERERLAQLRVLHDGAVQTLEVIGSGRLTDLDAIRSLADQEAARLLRELDPAGTDDRELDRQLAAVVDEHRTAGLAVSLDGTAGDRLPPDVAAAITAAAGEALTNVRKHAGAAQARVTVRAADTGGTRVRVDVEDDGCGFDPSQQARGFGLTESVGRRLAEVGGRSSIDSSPGLGTRVSLEWPS